MLIYQKKIESMIRRLKGLGITNKPVLDAMAQIPRHLFISEVFGFQAYDEKALPIGFGQTISHPYTVAKMTELLSVNHGDKILEIGTGSGYQAAVLVALDANLFSIEINRSLGEKSKNLLAELGYHAAIRIGDGSKGWKAYAPFKRIIVTAGAPVIPEALIDQLDDDGILLIPVGGQEKQKLIIIRKFEGKINKEESEDFTFVPLLIGEKK